LVKVAYAGIEASDILQNVGAYGSLAKAEPAPVKNGLNQVGDCGSEGVGTVVRLGPNIQSSLQIGQSVFYFGSTFREYTVIPAKNCFPCPDLNPIWTAVPISGLTALGGLEILGKIHKGQNVLVTAAAGGTGQFAVQWAKYRGCRVAGTCSSAEKAQLLKSLGCDVIINYKTEDVNEVLKREFPKGLDLIYESVGGPLRLTCFNNLAIFGHLIIIGSVGENYENPLSLSSQLPWTVTDLMSRSVVVGFFFLGHTMSGNVPGWPELVKEFLTAIHENKVKILVDKGCENFCGFEGIRNAQQRMRKGENAGKIYTKIQ
jgi:NADPH:quinone reductase-like Zn-dependent oxidoreductase